MNTISKKIKIFITFSLFLTFFLLGTYFGQKITLQQYLDSPNYKENIKKSININKKDLDLTLFWNVYNVIKDKYYDVDKIIDHKLVYGAIKGMVDSIGDKHTNFMEPEENSKFQGALSGDFEGIGAVVERDDLGILIKEVIKGSPAKKSGLIMGDIITKAGEYQLKGLNIIDAVSKIKGPANTKVTLTILRGEEKQVIVKEVTRKKIKIPSINSELFEVGGKKQGYISINIFGDLSSSDFKKSLDDLVQKNIDGLIIDLRDNGGGYLQSAVQILSNFVKKGDLLVTTKYKNRLFNTSYSSLNSGNVFDKPIVILINGHSASASEITAGTLRDYNKALLVGEKSYGKGSVQEPFPLGDGSLLKITIAKWYTSGDYNIDGVGLKPDLKVSLKEEDFKDPENIYDRQLEEAKKILNTFIEKKDIKQIKKQLKKEVEKKEAEKKENMEK